MMLGLVTGLSGLNGRMALAIAVRYREHAQKHGLCTGEEPDLRLVRLSRYAVISLALLVLGSSARSDSCLHVRYTLAERMSARAR